MKLEDGRLMVEVPAPKPDIWKDIVDELPLAIRMIGTVGLFKAFVRYFAHPLLELYKIYGHTIEGQKFVDRRGIAIGAAIVAFLSIVSVSGSGVPELIKELLQPVLNRSTPISRTPENQARLTALQDKVEEVLGKDVYLKSTLSGEFVEVSEDEIREAVVNFFTKLHVLLKEGKIDIDFSGFKELPRDQQVYLANEYDAIPDQWKEILKQDCEESYPKMVEFKELALHFKLIASNQGQGSSYPEEAGLSTRIQAPEVPQPPRYIQRQVCDLPTIENPNLTVREDLQQRGDGSSPLYSYEEYTSIVGPAHFQKALESEYKTRLESVEGMYNQIGKRLVLDKKVREQLERAQLLTAHNSSKAETSTSNQELTGSGFLTLSERHGSPGNSPWSVPADLGPFSNYSPFIGGSNAQSQLVPRDQPSNKSDPFESPGNSPTSRPGSSHTPNSPLEDTFEKSRYVVWIGSGLCASVLFTTIQIAWVILRKLDYTQDLVNKMIGKGVPKFLLFWIRQPNPGPVDGKPLSQLMIAVLAGNIIIPCILMKMVYFVP